MTRQTNFLPCLSLFITSIIWGGGFIFTAAALEAGMHPTVVIALRFIIPAGLMTAVFLKKLLSASRTELRGGVLSGMMIFAGFMAQTYGISLSTPANNAFITATNVIMVPYISWILSKKHPGLRSFILTCTCFIGTVILSWVPGLGFRLNLGDGLTLLCAFLFACQISYLSVATKQLDSVVIFNLIQLLTAGVLSAFTAFMLDTGFEFSTGTGIVSVLYLGILSTGLCYFLQTWAQRRVSPSRAAIILSLEGLFGSLFSVWLGYDRLTPNLLIGGLIILLSVILIQVDFNELPAWLSRGKR